MKTPSSVERGIELYDAITTSASKPIATLEYYNVTKGTWDALDDVKSISFSREAQSSDVGEFVLVPPAKSMTFSLDNSMRKYSPRGAGKFASLLKRGLRVRASIGYKLLTPENATREVTLSYYASLCRTVISGGAVSTTPVGAWVDNQYLPYEFTHYGDMLYGAGTYTAEGYYIGEIQDFSPLDVETITGITVTANGTGIRVYYREGETEETLGTTMFTYAGNTENGTATITLPNLKKRYFQFAFVFDTGVYGAYNVSAAAIEYSTYAELFAQGEYLLDSVDYSTAYDGKEVSVSCRDDLKKAIETKISTEDVTGADIAEIIRDVAERAGIEHNDGTTEYIPDTGYTVTVTGYSSEVARDALNELMFYLNSKSLDYVLIINDEKYLQLTKRPTSLNNFDIAFNYIDHLISLSSSFSSDDVMKSCTVYNEKPSDTSSNAVLGSGTYTAAGTYTISWSSTATNKKYKFIYNSGNGGTFTNPVWNTDNKSFTFGITGSDVSIAVTVYGDVTTLDEGTYMGEAVNQELYDNDIGYDEEIICKYIQSNAEAQAAATAMIQRFYTSDSDEEVSFTINAYPVLEINDRVILIDKNTNILALYYITSIATSYNAGGAELKHDITAKSISGEINSFVWDRNNYINGGTSEGDDDLDYDTGMFWDMDMWNEEEDDNEYPKRNIAA